MDIEKPNLKRREKDKKPSHVDRVISISQNIREITHEDMIEDGKFPVKLARDGSYRLLDFITYNEQHSDPEEKRSFVYIHEDAWNVSKALNSPTAELNIHELQEDIRRFDQYIATPKSIQREAEGQIYNISVVDGEKIKNSPYLSHFFKLIPRFQGLAERLWGGALVPLHDQAAVNINLIAPGGEQGFHYDRNEVTILLYLSDSLGGDLEFKPDSKTPPEYILIHRGELVALVGANKIYHRVTKVQKASSGGKRIAVAFGFGLPNKNYKEDARDKFLYTNEPVKVQKVFEKNHKKR